MKTTLQKSIALAATALVGIAVLPGCSGPQEDVRISFCKNLITKLLEPASEIEWKDSESQIKRPEYAAIKLQFETEDHEEKEMPMQATCFYAYDTADENVMTQSDPLSAYSTLPYQMTLNDQSVSAPVLSKAINAVQLSMGKAVVDSVKKGVDDTIQQVKSGIENIQSQ